jgi:hypothetical protein
VDQLPTDSMYHYGYELCSSFADLFIYSNEADFMMGLRKKKWNQDNAVLLFYVPLYTYR